MGKDQLSMDEVLSFNMKPRHRQTVRRYYDNWRKQHGLEQRCDNPDCWFHNNDMVWNGRKLDLILDHINGNSRDNRTNNLRLLCPNCDSQLPTRGGRNKGRIKNLSGGGFNVAHRDGRYDTLIFPATAKIKIKSNKASISATKDDIDA